MMSYIKCQNMMSVSYFELPIGKPPFIFYFIGLYF